MKTLDQFNIDIYKLKNGLYDYTFSIDNSFFEAFENSLVTNGSLKASLTLDKADGFISTVFSLQGYVELICDRTLRTFNHEMDSENKLIYKFGDEDVEISDEIRMIPREAQRINVAQDIYEYICLAVPLKKLHPDTPEGQHEGDDGFIVYQSDEVEEKEENNNIADPRWEKLKQLKNNKKNK